MHLFTCIIIINIFKWLINDYIYIIFISQSSLYTFFCSIHILYLRFIYIYIQYTYDIYDLHKLSISYFSYFRFYHLMYIYTNNNNAMITRNYFFLVQLDLNALSRKAEKTQRDSRRVVDKKIEGQRRLSVLHLLFKILLGVECTKRMITIIIHQCHGWSLLVELNWVVWG